MTERETARTHPATITRVQRTSGKRYKVTMTVDERSFQADLTKDRVTIQNLDFTKQEGGTDYNVELEPVVEPPNAGQQVLVEFPPEKTGMNLHWPLPPRDPRLPVSLVLWCQVEGKPRRFGLRYGSTYDCPCGEFLWDVFNLN